MGAPAWVSTLSSNYSSDGALDFACHCFSAAAALLPLSMLASLQLLWWEAFPCACVLSALQP